jgi:hypothetical protein
MLQFTASREGERCRSEEIVPVPPLAAKAAPTKVERPSGAFKCDPEEQKGQTTYAIEIILHFAEYHATMGGIYKSKGES